MDRFVPILSRILLVVGGLLILSGLGWGLWTWLHAPPPPEITDAGAVVLAVTAPVRPVTRTPTPTQPPPTPTSTPSPTTLPSPTPSPPGQGSRPAPSADLTATALLPSPTPTTPPPTRTPTPSPTPAPPEPRPPIRIMAPAIGLDAAIVPMSWEMVDEEGTMVSRWIVPADAAGWHVNSAMPGQGENVVLSGHHNIEGKVFRYVVDLEPGDTITVDSGEATYEYMVSEKYILKEAGMPLKVRQKNAQWIMPTGDERLTLVTCWPYDWPGNSHRVVVVARPASDFEIPVEQALDEQAR